MKIYTMKNKSEAEQIRQLFKLNAECAKLHWSQSITNVPNEVFNALDTIESFVETRVFENCDYFGELSETDEKRIIELIHNATELKETLGTGVVTSGEADKVKNLISSYNEAEEILKALSTGRNIILF